MSTPEEAVKAMDAKVSDSCIRALLWLLIRGGEGVVDKFGRILAEGHTARQFDASTWLRLGALNFIRGRFQNYSPPRIYITQEGKAFIQRINIQPFMEHPDVK